MNKINFSLLCIQFIKYKFIITHSYYSKLIGSSASSPAIIGTSPTILILL